jgi:MFS family permease
MLYLFAVIFGFVWGGAFVPISPMVAELYGMRAHGVLFGFINLNFAVGSTIGPVLLGYIFDITGSYQLGLLLLFIVSLICLTLALLLQPIRKKKVLGIP